MAKSTVEQLVSEAANAAYWPYPVVILPTLLPLLLVTPLLLLLPLLVPLLLPLPLPLHVMVW